MDMKILIIEDDKWFAESLALIIKSILEQCSQRIVHTAETAMTVIDEWQPDLLLLDLMLGTKNGLVLLHELQSYIDTRRIPIIIISIDGKRLNLDDLKQLGVVDVIDKTEMTPESLYTAINKAKETNLG